MIRLTLATAEVELEVVEPGDAGVDVFAFEDLGQVFVMGFEQVRMGGIVEGNDDGVIANADIAVDAAEDGGGEVGGVPDGAGIAEALVELMADGLGDERQGHLTESDVEVEGAGAFPAEGLIGVKELLDMPALGVVDGQVEDLVAIAGSAEGLVVEVGGSFPGALDELAVGGLGMVLEVKGTMGGGPSRPARLKVLRGMAWSARARSCVWRMGTKRSKGVSAATE